MEGRNMHAGDAQRASGGPLRQGGAACLHPVPLRQGSGEDIPFHARIVAVADAYDAMRSDRVYRKGMDPEKIRRELERGRGSQFDPALAEAMLTLADDGTLDRVTEQSNAFLSAQGDLVWSREKKNEEKQPTGE